MCGIVAGSLDIEASGHLLDALARLEYRGYDSAGIAVAQPDGRIVTVRTVRRVEDLNRRLRASLPPIGGTAGIGHTRWATHGVVAERNAHPHADCSGRLSLVHNGIIENAPALRFELELAGHVFLSEVDSEVIVHLIEAELEADRGTDPSALTRAVECAASRLTGSWAFVVLDAANGHLVATAHRSPLVVARFAHGDLVASDIGAIAPWVERFHVVEDDDVVDLVPGGRTPPDWRHSRVPIPAPREWPCVSAEPELGVGQHADYMAKEIDEQPRVAARVIGEFGTPAAVGSLWGELGLGPFERVTVLGCGTSLNAGGVIGGVLARVGGVPVRSIVASEAEEAVAERGTLVIALSQSGETADLLRALDIVRDRGGSGAGLLAITNNPHSALGRRADALLPCHAGSEVGVAATKTFTAQVLTGVCAAIAGLVATRRISRERASELVHDLQRIPGLLAHAIDVSQSVVPTLTEGLRDASGFLFLGRGPGVVLAAEGALKLKELTYRWAEHYPSGELKHGPLALVEPGTPAIVIGAGGARLDANVAEVQARGGLVVRIGGDGTLVPALGAGPGQAGLRAVDWLGPLEAVAPLQILARSLALALGRDVDKPRNLAKSVTVE